MVEELEPTAPFEGSAYSMPYALPRELSHALDMMEECEPLRDMLGEKMIEVLVAVKKLEYDTYLQVISSWEREHLLLNV
jgi:glutamine synthetase